MNIEPLETRIAPAAVFTYTDVDGDRVTITTSLGVNADLAAANILDFSDPDAADPRQLFEIDLSRNAAVFAGTNLSVTVLRGPAGDGFAHVGRIDATGSDDGVALDLGTVSIAGDLAEIDAGDQVLETAVTGIKLLSVRSMGVFGAVTGAIPNGDGTLESNITGGLGALKVVGDVTGVWLNVEGAFLVDGPIGPVTIGGSLIGGGTLNAGSIQAEGSIGAVKIGRDVQGGAGQASGRIQSDAGTIASVTLGGSLLGGMGPLSGLIRSSLDLGAVKIGGKVQGGAGSASGNIATGTGLGTDDGDIVSITIGGSLLGGAGSESGRVRSTATMGPVKIVGDIRGGDGNESGKIEADGALASLILGGSLIGGPGNYNTTGGTNGQIHAQSIGNITIGGSVVGGDDPDPTDAVPRANKSGTIFTEGSIGFVKIGGDFRGGSGVASAFISTGGTGTFQPLAGLTVGGSWLGGSGSSSARVDASIIGPVKIGGDFLAGKDENSALLFSEGSIASLTIGGSMSGNIIGEPDIGPIKIGRDFFGVVFDPATDNDSGIIDAGSITSLTIGGSLIGASASSGFITGAGVVDARGDIGPVKIGGNIEGGSVSGSGSIVSAGSIFSRGRIASIFIGGSIIAGTDTSSSVVISSGSISAGDDIGAVTIKGSLLGNAAVPVLITARGQETPSATSDVAIKSLTIGGRVEHARILAGYTRTFAENQNASIGAVKVGGDWIASDLIAGVKDNADTTSFNDPFGDADDTPIDTDTDARIARIASITIAGIVLGTAGGTDHFGFVAQQIGAFKAAGFTAALIAGPPPGTRDVIELSPLTGDVTIREV